MTAAQAPKAKAAPASTPEAVPTRKAPKAAKAAPVAYLTGKADFTTSKDGVTTPTRMVTGLNGVSTVADVTSAVITTAYPTNWLLQMMESEGQRRQRLNAQAIAQVLGLIALGAAKLAKRRGLK